MFELIKKTIIDSIRLLLGIQQNTERFNKLESEVTRLQLQVDTLQTRWHYLDTRLDKEEKTTTMMLSDRELLESKINRSITNSEHAIQIANNATKS